MEKYFKRQEEIKAEENIQRIRERLEERKERKHEKNYEQVQRNLQQMHLLQMQKASMLQLMTKLISDAMAPQHANIS